MGEFEKEVLQRLTRVEALISNGLTAAVKENTAWRQKHPRTCPFEDRRSRYTTPILVAVITAVLIKAPELIGKLVG